MFYLLGRLHNYQIFPDSGRDYHAPTLQDELLPQDKCTKKDHPRIFQQFLGKIRSKIWVGKRRVKLLTIYSILPPGSLKEGVNYLCGLSYTMESMTSDLFPIFSREYSGFMRIYAYTAHYITTRVMRFVMVNSKTLWLEMSLRSYMRHHRSPRANPRRSIQWHEQYVTSRGLLDN